MATNPCNVAPAFRVDPLPKPGVFMSTLDAQFDNYPFYLSLGLTCEDIRPDFDFNAANSWIAGTYCVPGETFARPDTSFVAGFTWPSIPGPIIGSASNYGFSIYVQVTQNGVVTPRGRYNVGYLLDNPACVDDVPTSAGYHQVITDDLTGTFPIVIGEDGITSVVINVSDYQGVPPFTGTVVCDADTTEYNDDLTGFIRWPGGDPELNYVVDCITGIVDPEALWCCVTEGQCCVTPSAAGPRFLIPPPEGPRNPVEENSTAPVLNQAIYLSNYTFQFVNNFGRVPRK